MQAADLNLVLNWGSWVRVCQVGSVPQLAKPGEVPSVAKEVHVLPTTEIDGSSNAIQINVLK